MNVRPTLWHLPISHYSEKARWALDVKGVEHRRRTAPPGIHMAVALRLTRGRGFTFPILVLDGRAIADSTAIVQALEERYPDPPLYPGDPGELARALALEDTFDEELGPYMRRLAFHEARRDRERFALAAAAATPGPLRRYPRLCGAYARGFTAVRFLAASDRDGRR